MLEIIFLMIAAAAGGAGGGMSSSSAQIAPSQIETGQSETGQSAEAAPVTDENTVAALPTFLAPSKEEDSAQAAPTFLAPTEPDRPAAPSPLFLTPDTDQTQAAQTAQTAPAFLAPQKTPELVAEPQVPTGRFTTATEVKPILNATRSSWILVREYDGKDLLYVTHLWSWRCGLLEMRVGINGDDPEVWPMPECRLDQPSPAAILESDSLPFAEFPLGSIALIEIELTYDDLSTDSAKFNRQGMLLP